jgi:purine-nucleoside phosphorylase
VKDERSERLAEAVATLKDWLTETPDVAITLGSGLSKAFGVPEGGRMIPAEEIPHYPRPTVAGHAGVTNASGAINPDFRAGDLVVITDHINMLGANPLHGPNLSELGPRFPDMSAAYSPRLRRLAKEVADEEGIELKEGVYVAALGPSYETPAEIKAFRAMGADLVGMSTVPEVIAAAHAGMEILGISIATNLAAGVDPGATLTHEEVIETTDRKGAEMRRLLLSIITRL